MDILDLLLKTLTIISIIVIIVIIALKLRKKEEELPYELACCILTQPEQQFYKALFNICEANNLKIFVKVRLADIVVVKKGTGEYMKWFNKIRAKHVDFLICTEDLDFLLGVELEDKSHLQEERIQRDEFVDRVYEAIGLPLIHIWEWEETSLYDVIIDSIYNY